MKINETVSACHKMAYEKGWWETPRTQLEIHALIHSEISEATEEVRDPAHQREMYFRQDLYDVLDELERNKLDADPSYGMKPEGEAVELVDAVIRIWDYFGHRGWDFEKVLKAKMKYNATRSHRHGGKLA